MTSLTSMRKACPSCGKPMKLVAAEDDTERERYVCAWCDGDPLHDPAARRWADSPLRPPAK
jgi:ribosomal protein S27AE